MRTGHLSSLVIGGRIILKWILKQLGVRMWTDFNLLRLGSSGKLLWTW